MFYNSKKNPLIPPLLINDKFVTDIKTKANILNNLFLGQCTSLKNDSAFPTSQRFLSLSRLHPLDFSLDEILKIIRSLDVNKPHGHDDISIRMIKMRDKSLVRQFSLLFERPF